MNSKEFKKGLSYLSETDPILDKIISNIVVLPPDKRVFDFSTFVSVIINQQLTGKAAETIRNRVVNLCNGDLNIENYKKLSKINLMKCGISEAKYNYIFNILNYLIENPNYFKKVKKMNSDELIINVTQFKGIGLWSSNIIALFYIGHMDVFPYGDVTLEKSIKKLYNVDKTNLNEVIEKWSPYKSVGSVCLWRWFDSGANTFD